MEGINKLRRLYHLKNVERTTSVKNRRESSAEHSWSCLILADYFMSIIKTKLDRLKVYELLMYHDVVEIEAGDTCISKIEERKNKKEVEIKAMKKLKEDFPEPIKEKAWDLFVEFEEEKTKEAKFAKAIDFLDAQIQELDYKEDWKGWSEDMLGKYENSASNEFPEVKEAFDQVLEFCKKEGYFDQ